MYLCGGGKRPREDEGGNRRKMEVESEGRWRWKATNNCGKPVNS